VEGTLTDSLRASLKEQLGKPIRYGPPPRKVIFTGGPLGILWDGNASFLLTAFSCYGYAGGSFALYGFARHLWQGGGLAPGFFLVPACFLLPALLQKMRQERTMQIFARGACTWGVISRRVRGARGGSRLEYCYLDERGREHRGRMGGGWPFAFLQAGDFLVVFHDRESPEDSRVDIAYPVQIDSSVSREGTANAALPHVPD
jgi:hypothetical protein